MLKEFDVEAQEQEQTIKYLARASRTLPLARLILEGVHRILGTEYVPLQRYAPLESKTLGQSFGNKQNILRWQQEQKRTDLGTQVWSSRHLGSGSLFHWAFIVGNVKYEFRDSWKKKDNDVVHESIARDGGDGGHYQFRAMRTIVDLDALQTSLRDRRRIISCLPDRLDA